MATSLSDVRDHILKSRGLQSTRTSTKSQKRLSATVQSVIPDSEKTDRMKLLELKHRKPIEDILSSGSVRYIEKVYGIDYSTASKWRRRLIGLLLRQLKYDKEDTLGDDTYQGLSGMEASQG